VGQKKRRLVATISFKILKDGLIRDLIIKNPNEEKFVNDSAIEAFRVAAPLPPPSKQILDYLDKDIIWDLRVEPKSMN